MDKSADTQAKPSEENGSHLRLRSNTETSKYSSTTEQQISGGSSQNEGSVINSETDPMDTTRRRRRVISFPKVARSSTGFLLNQRHTMNYDDCVTSPFEDEKEEYEDKEEDKDEDEDKEWVERERLSRQLDEEFSEGVDYATFTKQPTQRRNSRLTFFSIKSDEDDGPWEQEDDLNLDYDSDTYEYHDPWYSSTITNGKFARGGEIADVYDELSGNGIRYCTRKKKERRPTSWYGRFILCRWAVNIYDRGWMLLLVIVVMTAAFGFLFSICSRLCPENVCRFNGAKNNRNVITEAM